MMKNKSIAIHIANAESDAIMKRQYHKYTHGYLQ